MTISLPAAHRAFLSLGDWLVREPILFNCETSFSPIDQSLDFFTPILQKKGLQAQRAKLTFDRFGAPIAALDEKQSDPGSARLLASITDEENLRVTACSISDDHASERLVGVGIDVINVDDFIDMIDWDEDMLRGSFHDDEIEEVREKSPHLKAIALAKIFSSKEAAFKAWANIYHDHEELIAQAEGWCYLSDHYTKPLRDRLREGYLCSLTSSLFDPKRYRVLTRSVFIDERNLATLATCRTAPSRSSRALCRCSF